MKIFNENPPQEGESIRAYCKRLSETLGIKAATLRSAYYRKFIPASDTVEPQDSEADILETRKDHLVKLELRRLLRKTQDHSIKLEKRLSVYERVLDGLSLKKQVKTKNLNDAPNSEYLNVVCLSDWHLEHNIDPEELNGFNWHDSEESNSRLQLFLVKLNEVIRKECKTFVILNGDMIHGYLRDSSLESATESPTQAIIKCVEMMKRAIETIQIMTPDIVVRCNYGNHGRTNRQKQMEGSYKNSFEWMAYLFLKMQLPKIDIRVSTSHQAVDDIDGIKIRSTHGDMIRGSGGVSKYVDRMDKYYKADYNFISHFHNLHHPTGNITINGSLVGVDAYVYKMGFAPELPKQSHVLFNLKTKQAVQKNDIVCV